MNARDFVDAAIKYEHHGISMPRFAAFIVGVCLSASAIARADTPSDPDLESRYDLLVKTGNQARLAGRHKDAATAYKAALDIHRHPVISGRLGLALLKLGQIDRAAEELHLAMEQGQGVTTQERNEVTAAYDKAKTSTTWVTVIISHTGAKVTCDDLPWNRGGHSSFWRFAMPGEHTLRAQLDGFEDAVHTFTAKPGEKITISLNLVPLAGPKLPELPASVPVTLPDNRVFPPVLPASNVAGDPTYSSKEDPFYGEPKDAKPAKKKSGPRFSVNGGVVTVFGVASWNPAVGGVIGVGLRPKEFVSFGLEGRAAWLTTGVGGGQISAMTAGGNLSVCGHIRWFFGCALGHIGTIDVTFSEGSYNNETLTFIKPGIGGRVGADIRIASNFILQPSVDVLGLRNGTKLVAGGQVVADQPAFLASGQLTGGWEF
jgi:hypothetical protein